MLLLVEWCAGRELNQHWSLVVVFIHTGGFERRVKKVLECQSTVAWFLSIAHVDRQRDCHSMHATIITEYALDELQLRSGMSDNQIVSIHAIVMFDFKSIFEQIRKMKVSMTLWTDTDVLTFVFSKACRALYILRNIIWKCQTKQSVPMQSLVRYVLQKEHIWSTYCCVLHTHTHTTQCKNISIQHITQLCWRFH